MLDVAMLTFVFICLMLARAYVELCDRSLTRHADKPSDVAQQ